MKFTNQQQHINTSGYSLVETLVAISILLIAVVGPITVVVKSIQTATFAREQVTATFLAQEGIEAVVADRNTQMLRALESGDLASGWDDWRGLSRLNNCFVDDGDGSEGCNIDFRSKTPFYPDTAVKNCATISNCRLYLDEDGDRSVFVTNNTGTPSPYTRVIKLRNQGGGKYVQVKVTVIWESKLFATDRSVTVTTILSDAYSNF